MTTGNTITDKGPTTSDNEESPLGQDESTEPNAETEEQEVDWKVKFEESEAANLKLNNDNKSLLGRLRQPPANDAIGREILDELGGQRKRLNAFFDRTASGETDELPADLVKLDAESDLTRAARQYEQGFVRMETQLEDALKDEDGALIVDIESPEVAELIKSWTAARNNKNLLDLSDVVTDANKLARKIEREKLKKAAEDAQGEEKEAGKAREKKAGMNNLSIDGPKTGSNKGMSWDKAQQITNIGDMTDDQYLESVGRK